MTRAELESHRDRLIRRISEVDDERVLNELEECLVYNTVSKPGDHPDYPYAPASKEEFHRVVHQVLEDDRNGKFIAWEDFKREMDADIAEGYRLEGLRR